MSEGVQQSLMMFSTTGWEIVDEWDLKEGVGVLCPDCRESMQLGYWPVTENGVDGVHGVGCERCQTVCPFPPPSERAARLGHGNERVAVPTRGGEEIIVGVAHVDEDRSANLDTDHGEAVGDE